MNFLFNSKISKSCSTSCEIQHGKDPNDLPDVKLETYETGPNAITAACTGPDEGLTAVKRSRLHFSAGADIDFIDTNQDLELDIRKSSITTKPKQFSRFRSDQNANKPFTRPRKGSKSHEQQQEAIGADIKNEKATINVIVSLVSTTTTVKSMDTTKSKIEKSLKLTTGDLNRNSGVTTEGVTLISNSKEILPNGISNDVCLKDVEKSNGCSEINATEAATVAGVSNWKQEHDHAYGMAVSLYEKNFITQEQAGNPIADCFGLVVRGNSAALAIADGVNWGNFCWNLKVFQTSDECIVKR